MMYEVTLYIKKPNLFPEKNKVCNWGFLFRGRDINARMCDESFLMKINKGLPVAQGDRLLVDLKAHFKWDESFMTYIETNRFDVMNVKEHRPRPEQPSFSFE